MIQRFIAAVALATVSLNIIGCGGGENPSSFSAASFAGSYSAAYTRADGTLTITVDSTSQVTVVIADSADGVYTGSGSVNHVGGFFITCTGKNSKSITVSGTLKGSGIGRTAGGTVAGSISFPFTASFSAAPDGTLWANAYMGSWNLGTSAGNMLATVGTDGNLTGQLLLAGGDQVPLSGRVFTNGSTSFEGSLNGTTYRLRGSFRLSPPSDVVFAGQLTSTSNGQTTVGDANMRISQE